MNPTDVFQMAADGKRPRILAFGSSNTERFLSGMHWIDCFDLGIHGTYGLSRCINTGIGGETAAQLLDRYDQEGGFFKPHLCFITIGGNDSNPDRGMPVEEYSDNLRELHRRFTEIDCAVVFQTYYSPDPKQCGDLKPFFRFMQAVRDVAAETGSELVDQLVRWEKFRERFTEEYESVMRDGFHVNNIGNMLMGLNINQHFGFKPVGEDNPGYWQVAKAYHQLMNVANEE